mmetsp:Transcript_18500/g.46357  ORF Transcript_18500/g.46357 Transcript_18500/m.46357 type:complete len:151 (+) Transcript_18500:17-469(+)
MKALASKRLFTLLLLLASVDGLATRKHPATLWAKQAEDSPLPPGWYAAVDPRSKRTYYWNRHTMESRWQRPVAPAATVEPEVVPKAAEPEPLSKKPTRQQGDCCKRGKESIQRACAFLPKFCIERARMNSNAPILGAYLTSLFIAAASFL